MKMDFMEKITERYPGEVYQGICRSVTCICHLDLSILKLIASCDRYHAWGRRRLLNLEHLVAILAGPVFHTCTQYIDFVDIFNISLDLSTIYFAYFRGC